MRRYCKHCKGTKDSSHFYKIQLKSGSNYYRCKQHHAKYVKSWKNKQGESFLKKERFRYKKLSKRQKSDRFLGKTYGITSLQKEQMLQDQNYRCLIGLEKLTYKTAHVDHCHTTGRIRGLLCNKCNVGLGMFGDRPDTLKRAVKYLEGDDEQKRRNQRQETTG